MFRSVGGYHFLYADTFLSREEFEEMFDLTAYEIVRKKYQAEGNQEYEDFLYKIHNNCRSLPPSL